MFFSKNLINFYLGQRNDVFRISRVVVPAKRFRTDNGAAVRFCISSLRAHESVCRSCFRTVG